MIYTVCIMGFATFSYKRSAAAQVLVAAVMTAIAGESRSVLQSPRETHLGLCVLM